MPVRPPHPYLQHPGPLLLAHRGGGLEALENSPAAFARCADLGLSHVEIDVHATSDGVCVVFHDDTLDRTTDTAGRVEDMTWKEVSLARIGGREPILTLDELLERYPTMRFNIDVKTAPAMEPLARCLVKQSALERVLVGSFSHVRLSAMRRLLGPELATSMSTREVTALVVGLGGVSARHAVAAQVPLSQGGIPVVTTPLLRRAHDLGLQVHAWTVNDEDMMIRLLDMGIDGIVTDRPSTLRAILEARGQWHPAA